MSTDNSLKQSQTFKDIFQKACGQCYVETFKGSVAEVEPEERRKRFVREILLRGTKRLGNSTAEILHYLSAITDIDQLEQILENTFTETSWSDLLNT